MIGCPWDECGAIKVRPSETLELLKGGEFDVLAFVVGHGLDGDPLAAGEEV